MQYVSDDLDYFKQYLCALAVLRAAIENNDKSNVAVALQHKIDFDCFDTLQEYLNECLNQHNDTDLTDYAFTLEYIDELILDVFSQHMICYSVKF